MAYTAPTPRSTGDLITASIYNTDIVDNIAALKSPPTGAHTVNEASDLVTNSTTFTNIDADLSLAITTTGGDVIVHFECYGGSTAGGVRMYLDFTVDGTRHAGDDGISETMAATLAPMSFTRIVQGLSAGLHTFVMQWKSSAASNVTIYAGAGTANTDLHPQFWVREMS